MQPDFAPRFCKTCHKPLQVIGSARRNGKQTHGDWAKRTQHKKCWQKSQPRRAFIFKPKLEAASLWLLKRDSQRCFDHGARSEPDPLLHRPIPCGRPARKTDVCCEQQTEQQVHCKTQLRTRTQPGRTCCPLAEDDDYFCGTQAQSAEMQ